MEFLKFLEGIRTPLGDFLFSAITHLGEETFFLVAAILVFWCIDKRGGYYVLITGFIGTILNQCLKLTFRVDRPWIKDPGFKPVGDAIAEATGFSFPSGHTQNIAGTFGAIALYFNKKWVKITALVVITLVAFSRMYLGVHTPQDVSVSLFIAAALIVVLYPFYFDELRYTRRMPWIVGICLALAIGFVVFVNVIPVDLFDTEAKLENLYSGMKNAATLFGCIIGLCVIYPIERFFVKFETQAPWYSQILKLVLGFGGILAIKEGLKTPLKLLCGLFVEDPEFLARGIRYFLIVVFAGIVWPLTFKFFKGLKIAPLDRFAEWVKGLFAKKKVEE